MDKHNNYVEIQTVQRQHLFLGFDYEPESIRLDHQFCIYLKTG